MGRAAWSTEGLGRCRKDPLVGAAVGRAERGAGFWGVHSCWGPALIWGGKGKDEICIPGIRPVCGPGRICPHPVAFGSLFAEGKIFSQTSGGDSGGFLSPENSGAVSLPCSLVCSASLPPAGVVLTGFLSQWVTSEPGGPSGRRGPQGPALSPGGPPGLVPSVLQLLGFQHLPGNEQGADGVKPFAEGRRLYTSAEQTFMGV